MRRVPYLGLVPEEGLSAQGKAYHFIRDQVIGGAFIGGAKLLPDKIAIELGISRMPVREALRQLDSEGLVTILPNRGAIVTPLSPSEIEELFQIRAVLEGLAARVAAQHATDEDIDELELLNKRLQRVQLDGRQWLIHHDEFHDFLCEIGKQKRLQKEIRRIRTSVQPYLLLYISVYRQTEMVGTEHQALIDSIRSGNSHLAEQALANHVMSAGRGVLEFLKSKSTASKKEQSTQKREKLKKRAF
ncbi:MAG: GntR family transcriptional regulator [Betaproteobacteria bacterium]|nr:GntR family transcriptional regulator [Betaproteobacteria bacterium]